MAKTEDQKMLQMFEDINNHFKVEEIYGLLESSRYTEHHLKLIVIKLLLDKFDGSVKRVCQFLEKYDKYVYESTEVD